MQYLFFDLDGTLTDSYEGISKSICYALDAFGLPRPDEAILRACVGPPLYGSFERYFHMSKADAVRAVDKFRERYHETGWRENALISGAKECVTALKAAGKTLAVATGKPTEFARKILDKFDILQYFSAVVGSNLDGTRTDKAEEILVAMKLVGAAKEQSAMIGDRNYDIVGGKQAGIFTVGLDVGYAEEGELTGADPDVLFGDYPSLTRFLLEN